MYTDQEETNNVQEHRIEYFKKKGCPQFTSDGRKAEITVELVLQARAKMSENVNSTRTNTARTELHSMITFHHVNTRGSRAGKLRIAHLCVFLNNCHPRVMSRFLQHVTLTTSTNSLSSISSTSPIFSTVSLLHTSPLILDTYVSCDVPRQSGGSTKIPSLTGYEPKFVENKAIETEAIEPEDLQPRKIELERNLGTDPYQRQERVVRNSISEDMEEFGKVGAEMSYLQSQMLSDQNTRNPLMEMSWKTEKKKT